MTHLTPAGILLVARPRYPFSVSLFFVVEPRRDTGCGIIQAKSSRGASARERDIREARRHVSAVFNCAFRVSIKTDTYTFGIWRKGENANGMGNAAKKSNRPYGVLSEPLAR